MSYPLNQSGGYRKSDYYFIRFKYVNHTTLSLNYVKLSAPGSINFVNLNNSKYYESIT